MPPRYAYWTIIVDDQPTAFRAGALDDIMPTFNRLKEKQPTAKLMWFQSGKLWASRIDAREAMQVRGERGRYSDPRQDGGDKTSARERPKWKSRDFSNPRAPKRAPGAEAAPEWKPSGPEQRVKPDWKPKQSGGDKPSGMSKPAPEWKPRANVGRPSTGRRSEEQDRPEWKPKGAESERPKWEPKGPGGKSFDRRERPDWKAKESSRPARKPEWKPKSYGNPTWNARGDSSPKPRASSRERSERPEWKPKGAAVGRPLMGRQGEGEDQPEKKRQWIPKAEYKKLTGTEAKRDDKWRPGGEHKDPRQKYKDAKKAKWGRFKQAIRSRTKKKS